MIRLHIICICIFLTQAYLVGADAVSKQPRNAPPAISVAQQLLTPPAEAAGDQDALAIFYLDFAYKHRTSIYGEVAMRLYRELPIRHFSSVMVGHDQLKALAESTACMPLTRDLARERLAEQYQRRGEYTSAQALSRRRGIVPAWLFIGPFGRYQYSNFYTSFSPEKEIDLSRSYKDGHLTRKWLHANANLALPSFAPALYLGKRHAITYLVAQLESKKARAATLWIRTDSPFALHWNGKARHTKDTFETIEPRETILPVQLAAGWNRIQLKLYSHSKNDSLCLRLLNNNGEPIEDLAWEEENVLHPLPSAHDNTSSLPPQMSFSNAAQALTSTDANSPWDKALAAAFWHLSGDIPRGYELMEQALEAQPGNPHLLYRHALMAGDNTTLPSILRQNIAESACKQALKQSPSFVPALIQLAALQVDREKPAQALETLTKGIAAYPNALPLLDARLRLALKENWMDEASAWLRGIDGLYPQADSTHEHHLRLALRESDFQALMQYLQRTISHTNTDTGLWEPYLDLVSRQGNTNALEQHLSFLQGQLQVTPSLYTDLADAYRRMEQYDKADAAYASALQAFPYSATLYQKRAANALAKEDLSAALKGYADVLRFSPERHDVRNLIADVTGQDTTFWRDYTYDTRQQLKRIESQSLSGSTVRVIDQTVLQVYPDGSYANFTHEVQKVLTKGGIDDAARIPIYGSVLEARTITKEGQTVEPIRLPGQNQFTMPALDVGAVVEYQYLQHEEAPMDGALQFPMWYFRSPDIQEDFLISQYVVRVPKGYPFAYVERNLGDDVEFIRTEQGSQIVYSWTARNMPAAIHDPGTPHINEILPHIDIGAKRTWADINHLVMNVYLGRIRLTSQIRSTAASLTQGTTSPRDRITRLHAFVCQHIDNRPRGQTANQILLQKAGDPNILLMALLKANGFEPYFMFVRPSTEVDYAPNWEIPRSSYFPIQMIGVDLSEEESVYLDSRWATASPGAIVEDLHGATAFLSGYGRGTFRTLPTPSPDAYAQSNKIIIRFDGQNEKATVEGTRALRGKNAHSFAEMLKTTPHQQWQFVEEHLYAALPGVTLQDFTHTMEDGVSRLQYEAHHDSLLRNDGDAFLAPLCLQSLPLFPKGQASPQERRAPYHFKNYLIGMDTITVHLPDGVQLDAPPSTLILRTRFGIYNLQYRTTDNQVRITRTYRFLPQRITLDDWPSFVSMVQAIEQAEKSFVRWSLPTDAQGGVAHE